MTAAENVPAQLPWGRAETPAGGIEGETRPSLGQHPSLRVRGLDLSLTATGICGITRGRVWTETIPTPSTRTAGHPRLETIRQAIQCYTANADLVVIEGLAFDAHDTERANAGLSWIIRHDLHRRGIAYALVPPSSLKKYATGNGGKDTDKKVMLAAARAAMPDVDVADHNAADALWLALAGWHRLTGRSLIPGPGYGFFEHLSAVRWPEVGE